MPCQHLLQNTEDLKQLQQCVRSHIFFSYSSYIQLWAKGTFLSLVMFNEVDLIRQDIGSVVLAHQLFRVFFCWSLDGLVCLPDVLPCSCNVFLFSWSITLCLMCPNLIISWSNRKCQLAYTSKNDGCPISGNSRATNGNYPWL